MQLATCWSLHGKVPSQSDYLYLVLPRRPSRELLRSSAKPLTAQARGHHSRGRGVGQSGGRRPAAAAAETWRRKMFSAGIWYPSEAGGWQD